MEPFNLRTDTRGRIGKPSSEVWIVTQFHYQTHAGHWQSRVLENLVKSGPHFGVHTDPHGNFVMQRNYRRPQGQMCGKRNEGCKGPFLEGNNAARPHLLRQGAQYRNGIGKKLKYVATDGGIEPCVRGEMRNVTLDKLYVIETRLACATPRPTDRASVTLDRYDLSGTTHKPRYEHCDISHAGTQVQHVLPRTDASFAEEAFRNWGEPRGLPDQALVLCVRATKQISTLTAIGRHRTVHCSSRKGEAFWSG